MLRVTETRIERGVPTVGTYHVRDLAELKAVAKDRSRKGIVTSAWNPENHTYTKIAYNPVDQLVFVFVARAEGDK